MINKTFSKTGKRCQVTFKLDPDSPLTQASVVGDFNDWTPGAHPMTPRKNGHLGVRVSLPANQRFAYKFLTSDGRWLNDHAADAQITNEWGETNSVVDTSANQNPAPTKTPDKPATDQPSSKKKKAAKTRNKPAARTKASKSQTKKTTVNA